MQYFLFKMFSLYCLD